MDKKNKMIKCEFYNSDNKLSCYSCNYAKECLIMQIKEMNALINQNTIKCKEYKQVIDDIKTIIDKMYDN